MNCYDDARGAYQRACDEDASPIRRLSGINLAIREALELSPSYSSALLNLGKLLADSGQLAEAVEKYQQALRLRPDFADAHNNLGAALAGLGRLDEAIVHYQKAIDINPNFVEARFNLANAMAARGNLNEAIAHLQKLLTLANARNNTAQAAAIRARVQKFQSEAEGKSRILKELQEVTE